MTKLNVVCAASSLKLRSLRPRKLYSWHDLVAFLEKEPLAWALTMSDNADAFEKGEGWKQSAKK
jgi:hypothetical protein